MAETPKPLIAREFEGAGRGDLSKASIYQILLGTTCFPDACREGSCQHEDNMAGTVLHAGVG